MPTKIEWCDETFNPWWGCERVSPGCAHCYAATFSRRLGMDHLWPRRPSVQNGQEHGFRFFGDAHWDEPLKWARTLPAKLGRRPRIFCASMADVFEERPELDEHRERLFDLITRTPELDWLILTKRPEFARDWLAGILTDGWSSRARTFLKIHTDGLPNVWLGVSIENARMTWCADVLREIPAAVRFISAEPLLASLFTDSRRTMQHAADWLEGARKPLDLSGIDWLIIGESRPGARPFHLEHARELVAAARDQWVRDRDPVKYGQPAVFVKQLGARPIEVQEVAVGEWDDRPLKLSDGKGGDPDEWPLDLRIREWPSISSQLVPRAS